MQKFTQAYHNMKNKHLTTNRQVASQRTKKITSKRFRRKKIIAPFDTVNYTFSKNLETQHGNLRKFLNSIP